MTCGNNQAANLLPCDDEIAVDVFSRPSSASSKEMENFVVPSNCLHVSMRYVWHSTFTLRSYENPLPVFDFRLPCSEVGSMLSVKSSSTSFRFPLASRPTCHRSIASLGFFTNGMLPSDCCSNTATSRIRWFRQHRMVSQYSDWSWRALRSLHVSSIVIRSSFGFSAPKSSQTPPQYPPSRIPPCFSGDWHGGGCNGGCPRRIP